MRMSVASGCGASGPPHKRRVLRWGCQRRRRDSHPLTLNCRREDLQTSVAVELAHKGTENVMRLKPPETKGGASNDADGSTCPQRGQRGGEGRTPRTELWHPWWIPQLRTKQAGGMPCGRGRGPKPFTRFGLLSGQQHCLPSRRRAVHERNAAAQGPLNTPAAAQGLGSRSLHAPQTARRVPPPAHSEARSGAQTIEMKWEP